MNSALLYLNIRSTTTTTATRPPGEHRYSGLAHACELLSNCNFILHCLIHHQQRQGRDHGRQSLRGAEAELDD